MQTLQAIRKLRSVRIFNAKPVPRNLVEELMACAYSQKHPALGKGEPKGTCP